MLNKIIFLKLINQILIQKEYQIKSYFVLNRILAQKKLYFKVKQIKALKNNIKDLIV